MREFLKGLDLDKELIDTIMAEHGKEITGLKEQVESYKTQVSDYEKQIGELSNKAESNSKTQEELESLKKQIADRTLNDKIIEAIGDKKFVNDYTKEAIINEIKKSLDDDSNKGKSINDLLENFVEGKEGIFVEEKSNGYKATGIQSNSNSVPKEDGVMAILRQKHPDVFED